MKAADILETAHGLVSGNRETTHGSKLENHQNIADLWNGYLRARFGMDIQVSPLDVANMMECLKIARRLLGQHNPDDYVDGAGYAACAGEIAASMEDGERA